MCVLPDELDGVKASNLACCSGGIPLLLTKVGWHLQGSCNSSAYGTSSLAQSRVIATLAHVALLH